MRPHGISLFELLACTQVVLSQRFACRGGNTVPHSDRNTSNPCVGSENDECEYTCDSGYFAIGRHACQSYTSSRGQVLLDKIFFGGRCERLCDASIAPCSDGQVPVRWNSSDPLGPCFKSICLDPDEALLRLGRGAYRLWRLGRSSRTGIYSDSTNPSGSAAEQPPQAHIGINGVALMMECVAVELGWTSVKDAQARVNLTMSSLAGETPGFKLPRNSRGWIPTFFDRETGKTHMKTFTVLDTGLNAAGVLFAARYFSQRHPSASLTAHIEALSRRIWDSVQWEHLLCNSSGRIDAQGSAIPFTFDETNGCGALHEPQPDGFYEFSELHYTVWLSYGRACAGWAAGDCPNRALDRMWQAWQGRRFHPKISYEGFPLLSLWPSYIVHLPFYASHSFNSDSVWQSLFKSHWQADRAYYSTSKFFAGDHGRYGLAAGVTDARCSAKGGSYEADILVEGDAKGAQGCRHYSPYAVAGYLPAESTTIRQHLLQLLAEGESVFPFDDGPFEFVMLRKSMLEPGWNQNDHVSMVDFSSELFGLSTLWLNVSFWQTYTNHFSDSLAPDEVQIVV
eukprot:TRINITY_DN38329_c0_g1_i1.p1 TRINITY_DN38329_c0_g1~~TRINITY_DN38329_c0_g1_i1.p1  ORF type:complete len:566 (-),score=33.34 TRINITY_DN38329_c0_g1_i1:160-1857(-)